MVAIVTIAPAAAEMSSEELAKLAQNPVGNLLRRACPTVRRGVE